MRVAAIIQARMGSTRLPGKVMMKLQGKTVLDHVISRVKQSKEIDTIVIATTTKSDDATIAEEANRLNVKCFRGLEEDVLSRYYYAAKENKADVIVRITSDCPLIDSKVIDEAVLKFKALYAANAVDYLSNSIERTYPRGLDIEIVPFNKLEEAFNNADKPYQREHVTPYFYENPDRFTLVNYLNDADYSYYRLTLDTPEDFELITKIYEELYHGQHDFYLKELLELFERQPELYNINKHVEQKRLEE